MSETKALAALEVKDADRGEVEAIVAVLNVVDRDRDVIVTGAIKSGAKVKVSGWGHSAVYGGRPPVGMGTISIEGNNAVFRGKMFMSTAMGRESFAVLREMGTDQPWSIGYSVIGSETPSDAWKAKGALRILTKLDTFEVSPVLLGAGIGTRTVATKNAAPAPAAIDPELIERGRAWLRNRGVEETAVDAYTHAKALRFAEWAAGRWGVAPPGVKWATKDSATEWQGLYRHGESDIWVRADTPPEYLQGLCFHEVSHYARYSKNMVNNEAVVEADTAFLLRAWTKQHSWRWTKTWGFGTGSA